MASRPQYTVAQKKQMLLSTETLLGLRCSGTVAAKKSSRFVVTKLLQNEA